MAKLTDDADYDAGETFENVSSACRMLGIMTTTMADDFGLGAFYMVSLKTRSSCENEVNPLLQSGNLLVSFDVESMYTNISVDEAIRARQCTLYQHAEILMSTK
ncbi:unnamed protein product [Protopolystoma xenopodis]|uniref:Uncharacterized protein n=1 Tax=Protopolystoma xenopodis TaxID=117903 RepID=A0A448XMT1_9PLAT|nr:unnamed protein product [Protopolystoma xenopodis]